MKRHLISALVATLVGGFGTFAAVIYLLGGAPVSLVAMVAVSLATEAPAEAAQVMVDELRRPAGEWHPIWSAISPIALPYNLPSIDGTTLRLTPELIAGIFAAGQFVEGIPEWGVSIGLAVDGVADAQVLGGANPLVKISLDRRKLELGPEEKKMFDESLGSVNQDIARLR